MRDLLTTVASIMVILFCFSLLLVSGEDELSQDEVIITASQLTGRQKQAPEQRSTIFRKVQSVQLEDGVLKFITITNEGLKEHYFSIRNKNVVLVKNKSASLPYNTIRFDYDSNTVLVSIPPEFEVDFMESMAAK